MHACHLRSLDAQPEERQAVRQLRGGQPSVAVGVARAEELRRSNGALVQRARDLVAGHLLLQQLNLVRDGKEARHVGGAHVPALPAAAGAHLLKPELPLPLRRLLQRA